MTKVLCLLKNEFIGWKLWEILWLLFCTICISIISFFYKDSAIGIAGAICGIVSSVLTGKGKLSAYIIGGIGRIFYAIIAFKALYYGEVFLNLLYFVPMEFYGIYVWNKNMDNSTHEVVKQKMPKNKLLIYTLLIILFTILLTAILKYYNDPLPFLDSLTNTLSVFAMIITIKRYYQQWILWAIINCISISMWVYSFINGTGSIAILFMWIIYLMNSIIMLIKWYKDSNLIKE